MPRIEYNNLFTDNLENVVTTEIREYNFSYSELLPAWMNYSSDNMNLCGWYSRVRGKISQIITMKLKLFNLIKHQFIQNVSLIRIAKSKYIFFKSYKKYKSIWPREGFLQLCQTQLWNIQSSEHLSHNRRTCHLMLGRGTGYHQMACSTVMYITHFKTFFAIITTVVNY